MAPDTPVFILHLYDRALLNAAAVCAVAITKDTPDLPGGVIRRDRRGNPSGMLVAQPNALILYSTLAMGRVLPASPDWSPVRAYGGHFRARIAAAPTYHACCIDEHRRGRPSRRAGLSHEFWGALACSCFAF